MKHLQDKHLLFNIIIFIIIASTTAVGHFVNVFDAPYAAFFPGIGFAVGYYYVYDKDALVPIVLGLIVGHPLMRFIFIDEPLYVSSVYGSILVFADVGAMIIFSYIMNQMNPRAEINRKSTSTFIFAMFVAASLYSIVAASLYMPFDNPENFLWNLVYHFAGEGLGLHLVGSLVIYTFRYEGSDFSKAKPIWLSVLFIMLSMFLMFLVFYPISEEFSYFNYRYIILFVFYISAILFSFRMMILNILTYFIFAHTFFITSLEESQGHQVFKINFFLLIIVFISTVTRIIMLEIQKKTNDVEESNTKLEGIIESTFSLLKLGEDTHFKQNIKNEDYLIDLFNIARKIFKEYDRASCYIRGEEFVKYIAADGYDLEVLNNFNFRIEDFQWDLEVPMHVVNSNKLVKISMKDNYEQFVKRVGAEINESIIFCFYLDNDVVGGMAFDLDVDSKFKYQLRDFENYKSFQRIMNSFYSTRLLINKNNTLRNDIVLSLIRTLELYDQYTGGHSEEVANLSLLLAQRMGLDEDIQSNVYWAGIVHDIGKVGIPSEILNKPDRLSLEEYDKIKAHPGFGYEILKRSEDLGHIANLVKYHHEWWNGSGYPDGLVEYQIPLEARIIGVCDAVSSMATKRPYTEIKTSEEILKELKLYKGSQFSPKEAEEMIKFIEEGLLDKFYLEKDEL